MRFHVRSRFVPVLVAGVWLLASVPASPPVQAQTPTAAALFDDTVLHDIRLLINTRDLRQLRDRYLESFTVPADLVWRNTRIRNVGLRTRGAGSRNPSKLGLELTFDRYTTGQTFLGLSGLVLDNLWQDPSLFREHLSMAVFNRMGQTVPRESFARVYINNELQGVYGVTEPVDMRFATTATKEASGRLFEYRWVYPYFAGDLGDNLASYQQLFASRTTSTDTVSMLYGPIRDLFRAANDFESPDWRSRLDAAIDLPQLLTHIAIQGCVSNIDGFMGYAGLNNFYLYRFAGTNRHRLFAWDEDFAFQFVDTSIVRHGDEPVAFVDRALGEPDLRSVFLDAAASCAHAIGDDEWLLAEINRLVSLVGPAIYADPRKQFSNAAFDAEVEFLRSFAAARPAAVLAEVASLR